MDSMNEKENLNNDRRSNEGDSKIPNSPQKSHTSLSRVSDLSDASVDDTRARHKCLLPLPAKYDLGIKPKALTADEKGAAMKPPAACKGGGMKGHAKCAETIKKGNTTISELQGLLDEKEDKLVKLYKNATGKLDKLEKFTEKQYSAAEKIVLERNGLQDQVRRMDKLKEDNKKMKAKLASLGTQLQKNKDLVEDLAAKNEKLLKQLKEAKGSAKDGGTNSVMKQPEENPFYNEWIKMGMKHQFKVLDDLRKEKAEERRDEKKNSTKNSGSRGAKQSLDLMGMSGMFNPISNEFLKSLGVSGSLSCASLDMPITLLSLLLIWHVTHS